MLTLINTSKIASHIRSVFSSQTAYKLLDLYVRLRELGHPQYIQPLVNESLTCAISREDAEERVCVCVCVCVAMTVRDIIELICSIGHPGPRILNIKCCCHRDNVH